MEIYNTRDLLNAHLYPMKNQDVRRKTYNYFNQIQLVAGQTDYFFFVDPLSSVFTSNKRLPLAGSEVFFVEGIEFRVLSNVTSLGDSPALKDFLQESFLEVSIDNRTVLKIPGLDFVTYATSDRQGGAAVTDQTLYDHIRKLPLPIVINSTSAFEFKFVTTSVASTQFPFNVVLTLQGIQLDKLDSFYWDNLKNRQFQQVSQTYYETREIDQTADGSQIFFADGSVGQNLSSKTFPLSDIETMSIQDLEVMIGFSDDIAGITFPFNFLTLFQSWNLRISVDDVDRFTSSITTFNSMVYAYDQISTSVGVDTTAMTTFTTIRRHQTFPIPLEIPANSKVKVTLDFHNVGEAGTFPVTIALRGIETRRVA